MPKIKIEGQTINGESVGITDEIANDDELLKAALAPTWPDVRTATFRREGGKDGKDLVVAVQKKAGTKGGQGVSGPAEMLTIEEPSLAEAFETAAETLRYTFLLKLETVSVDVRANKVTMTFTRPEASQGEVSRDELTRRDRDQLRIAEAQMRGGA